MSGGITIYLPYFVVMALVGAGLWYMNNRWFAVGAWVLSAIMAGFINDPVITAVKNFVTGLV